MGRLGLAFPVMATALLVCAAGAGAATVEVKKLSYHGAYTGEQVTLRAAPGEANDITIAQEAPTAVTVADGIPLQAGTGCAAVSALLVRCMTEFDSVNLKASLADGDDVLWAVDMDARYAQLSGGPGDDHLVGPVNSQSTLFDGGPGDDLMEGGHGWDRFEEGAKRNGSDTFVGGSGIDSTPYVSDDEVDYRQRRHAISVSMDGRHNDGEQGEYDLIGTDIERVVGGSGADRMIGNAGPNSFDGGSGRDVLRGGAGDDDLVGDQDARTATGQADVIYGGAGDDRLQGGHGSDRMDGGTGRDSISTDWENDRVYAKDGTFDAILCHSPGRERIRHDGADFIASDCGRQRGPIPAHVLPLDWFDGGDRLFLALGCPFRPGRNCSANVTLEVAGKSFTSRPFTLFPGWWGWLMLPLGTRTLADPDPPLDGGVLTLRSTGTRGQVTTQSWPLSAVHRDPGAYVPSFMPPVLPFLTPSPRAAPGCRRLACAPSPP